MSSLVIPYQVVRRLLDYLSDDDLIIFCQVSTALVQHCRSQTYWRHRLDSRFGSSRINFETVKNPRLWYQRLRSVETQLPLLVKYLAEAQSSGEDSIYAYLLHLTPDLVRRVLERGEYDNYQEIKSLATWLARMGEERTLEQIHSVLEEFDEVDPKFLELTLLGASLGGHSRIVDRVLTEWGDFLNFSRIEVDEDETALDRALWHAVKGYPDHPERSQQVLERLSQELWYSPYLAFQEQAVGQTPELSEHLFKLLQDHLPRSIDREVLLEAARKGAREGGHSDLLQRIQSLN